MIDYRPSIYRKEKEIRIDGSITAYTVNDKEFSNVEKLRDYLMSSFFEISKGFSQKMNISLNNVLEEDDIKNFFNGTFFDERQEAISKEFEELNKTIIEELYLGEEENIKDMDDEFIESIKENLIDSEHSIKILKVMSVIAEYTNEISKSIEHTDNLKLELADSSFGNLDADKLNLVAKPLNKLKEELAYLKKSSSYNTIDISFTNCIKVLSNHKSLKIELRGINNPYVLKLVDDEKEDFEEKYDFLIKGYIYMKDINRAFDSISTELFEILKSVFGDNI